QYGDTIPYGVAVDAQGRIVVGGLAGYAQLNGSNPFEMAVIRLTTTGTLDSTFGTGGKVTLLPPGTNVAQINSLSLQSNGRIIAAGTSRQSTVPGSAQMTLVRLNVNGSLDDGSAADATPGDQFGVGGIFRSTRFPNALSLALQADGKPIVLGLNPTVANM